ncbi:TRAP transporter substrate-binding protein [Calidifontimicrobium sp. SYSU G02091]|uniref:TRAP transporter substrate-binding protein n=1 Tax=Calidifontimicrobium sp. SYSU G02091 TaxID=2926421 RepID=UPI001F52BB6D|nr:TRAP transporter substrate-binding protein [Calidifontimicrobium sp. SYSU G02091]MCI1190334.1 TRAP transporter substrate-binding protein [Calidifontimicrobium sp. SYSU G02091]
MNPVLKTLPGLAAATIAAIALTAALAAQAQALKLAHITPPTHVWHQVSEKIATDLEQASGGKMKIAISPLQKLGNEAQVVNLMQAGAVQFAVFTVGGLANREESLLGWSLPYVFKDVAHAARAADTPAAREMLKRLDASGLVGLGYTFAGMRHVLSLNPVTTPKDLAGKKIRAFPSPVYNDWWLANGAAPTAMPLSEVAPSLTTKLLDAVDIDLDALVGLKFYQQAPNLTLTNHMAFPGVIAVSKKWWDARTDAERGQIRKVVADAEKWGVQAAIDAEASNLKKAQADGTKVVTFDLKAFQAAAAPVRDKYVAKNPLIADFYKQAQGL